MEMELSGEHPGASITDSKGALAAAGSWEMGQQQKGALAIPCPVHGHYRKSHGCGEEAVRMAGSLILIMPWVGEPSSSLPCQWVPVLGE